MRLVSSSRNNLFATFLTQRRELLYVNYFITVIYRCGSTLSNIRWYPSMWFLKSSAKLANFGWKTITKIPHANHASCRIVCFAILEIWWCYRHFLNHNIAFVRLCGHIMWCLYLRQKWRNSMLPLKCYYHMVKKNGWTQNSSTDLQEPEVEVSRTRPCRRASPERGSRFPWGL